MQTTYAVRQSDTPANLPMQMVDANNSYQPYPLAGTAVSARMYAVQNFGAPHTGTPVITNRPCTVTDAPGGKVTMPWLAGDLATPGTYELDLVVTEGANHVTTVQSLAITILAEA